MNTIDKVVEIYFAAVCSQAFSYKGKTFHPKMLVVSPLIVRGFTCPSSCGACCGRFSLDYLPTEPGAKGWPDRSIQVDGRSVPIKSDLQDDVLGRFCRNLDMATGRCGRYDERPMACDFELIRVLHYDDKAVLTQKLYGRAWAMARIDEERGALCEMLPPDDYTRAEVCRKLARLQAWADHFGVQTRIDNILKWLHGGASQQLVLQIDHPLDTLPHPPLPIAT